MVVPSLLRENAQFRRFWLGQTVSLLGDQVSLIALPLVAVLTLDASAAQMGYLVAAELAPNLLLSLHAGAWADQRERKRHIMIATDLGRALLIGSIPLAYAFDALTFPHMFVVAFLTGTLSVLFHVSYMPALRRARAARPLDRGRLDHARKPCLLVRRGTEHRRPARADLSAPVTLVVDACSYVVSALFLRSVEAEEPPPEAPGKGHVVAGVRWVFGNPIVRAALGATATINFFNYVFFALFILYANKVARHRTGDARTRARRRRRRRRPRRGRHRSRRPQDRHRAGVRAWAASSSRRRSCSSRSPVGRAG